MLPRLDGTRRVGAVLCFVLNILRINSGNGQWLDPCTNYSLLSDDWRNINSPLDSIVKEQCDSFMPAGWYAFIVHNQAAMIPTVCTQDWSCGSMTPYHVQLMDNGTAGGGLQLGVETNARLCGSGNFNGSLRCCVDFNDIKIKQCSATLIVYWIHPFQTCPRTFCVLKMTEVMVKEREGKDGIVPLSLSYTTTSPPTTTNTASIPPANMTDWTPPTTASSAPVTSTATTTTPSPANNTEATAASEKTSATILLPDSNFNISRFAQATENPSQVTQQEEGKVVLSKPCAASVPLTVLVVMVCLCLVLLLTVIVLALVIYRKTKHRVLSPSVQEDKSCVQLTCRRDTRPMDDAGKAPMGCVREITVSIPLDETGSEVVSLEQALAPSRTETTDSTERPVFNIKL